MGDLMNLMGKAAPAGADRRRRLVEAVSYGRAVKLLNETDHVQDPEDLEFLRREADAELQAAIRSIVAGGKSPAEVRGAA